MDTISDIEWEMAMRFEGWELLDRPVALMVVGDFMRSGDPMDTYVSNVGSGNIRSYAECLIAGYALRGVGEA